MTNFGSLAARLGFAAVATAILTVPAADTEAQRSRFQAIAVDVDGGQIWGAAWGYSGYTAATEEAIRRCRNEGGSDCRIQVAGENNCVSLAMSDDQAWGTGYGGTREAAGYYAVQTCREHTRLSCSIEVDACWND